MSVNATAKKSSLKNNIPAEWVQSQNERWAYFKRQQQKELDSIFSMCGLHPTKQTKR